MGYFNVLKEEVEDQLDKENKELMRNRKIKQETQAKLHRYRNQVDFHISNISKLKKILDILEDRRIER